MAQPQPQKLTDCPADLFEKYLAATSETFAGLPPKPTQAEIQKRLVQAAEKCGVTGAHASVLALRYSLFVTLITQEQAALLERGLVVGEAGAGKTTTFARSFVAACARLPARFTVGGGFTYDQTMLWKLVEAAKLSGIDDPMRAPA
jgi:NaMN:DMB phosphoribosyltransferase